MGLFKKLKKLHKKSVGHKLLKKAVSKDPIGRKLANKDPIAKRMGLGDGDGGDRPKARGLKGLAQQMAARRTGGGNKPAAMPKPAGPNMRHMSTGGGAQKTPVGNTGVVGPRKPMRTGGPSPASRLSGLAGRSGRGIRR